MIKPLSEDEPTETVLQEGAGQDHASLLPESEAIDEAAEATSERSEPLNKDLAKNGEQSALKLIPPRGGRKFGTTVVSDELVPTVITEDRPVSQEPPIAVTEVEESPIDQSDENESAAAQETRPDQDIPVLKESVTEVETIKIDETIVTPLIDTELPSEIDEIPSNPLIPIIVKSDKENKLDESEEITDPESIQEKEFPQERHTIIPEHIDVPNIFEPENKFEKNEVDSDEYSLSADSSGKLIIHLDGTGWVFLSNSGKSELKLRDKSYEPSTGRTRFSFTVENNGEYGAELVFMKQDLLKGESQQKVLNIDADENPLNQNMREREKTDEVIDSIVDSGSESTAIERNRHDLSVENTSDEGQITASGQSGLTSSSPGNEEDEMNMHSVDLNRLNAAELFELALSYEKPGIGQSLETAMEIYKKIKSDFPVTEERFKAESRIRYLNKHYFKVQ